MFFSHLLLFHLGGWDKITPQYQTKSLEVTSWRAASFRSGRRSFCVKEAQAFFLCVFSESPDALLYLWRLAKSQCHKVIDRYWIFEVDWDLQIELFLCNTSPEYEGQVFVRGIFRDRSTGGVWHQGCRRDQSGLCGQQSECRSVCRYVEVLVSFELCLFYDLYAT